MVSLVYVLVSKENSKGGKKTQTALHFVCVISFPIFYGREEANLTHNHKL